MSTVDVIRHVLLSSVRLPLAVPISDAKVFTGRQKPMSEVVFLFAEITTEQGHSGIGFSYSKRAGGPAQYAHAKEVTAGIIGEDPTTLAKSTPSCFGLVPPWAVPVWPPRHWPPLTLRSTTSKPSVPACP
jgi:hypothetical protein